MTGQRREKKKMLIKYITYTNSEAYKDIVAIEALSVKAACMYYLTANIC